MKKVLALADIAVLFIQMSGMVNNHQENQSTASTINMDSSAEALDENTVEEYQLSAEWLR